MGKIMYLGDEYSSDGTTVIPNPEGEATDDLNTVQIGEDIFNVVGSGGGGGSVVVLPSLYSIKEKMVGLWTDNKPLYQKTFHIDSFTSTSWYAIDSNFTPDLYSIKTINSNGYVVNGGGYTNQRYTLIQTNGFWIRITQNSQGLQACIDGTPDSGVTRGNCDITVQYTKTTDTPVEDFNLQDFGIFAPVIYSLEEREIGVWTDGKPLYEKTVDCGNLLNNSTKTVAHGISNIEKIVRIFGYSYSGTNYTPLPFTSTSAAYSINVTANTTSILLTTSADRSTWPAFVTIQYTKTTDVAGSGSYAELGIPAVHIDDTERVIGTWFGETLYQKTLYDAGGKSGSFNINHGIENLKAVVNYSGCVTDVTYPMPLPRIAYDGNNVGIQSSGPTQIVLCNPTAFGTRLVNWYITIQYTKTTT